MLLSRDTFRTQVFARDGDLCVVCKVPAQDAHHIMERRLFDDGGYYLDNGASLCGACHIKAEQTVEGFLPCNIREKAGIDRIVLPPHLYSDNEYDKWGNIILSNGTRLKGELFYDESVQRALQPVLSKFVPYVKYPRTFHLPWSPGTTEDDRVLPDCSQFQGKPVVVTVKMDGENTSAYSDGYIHARSIDGRNHPSRNWVKNFLTGRIHELPKGWHICGENLYAKHSIQYTDLESYFYLFSIWNDRNECLNWEDTKVWAQLLGLALVPTLYEGEWNEEYIKTLWAPRFGLNEMEGFVVRNAHTIPYWAFRYNFAKYVRACHVQTNKHWIKTAIIKNELQKLHSPTV